MDDSILHNIDDIDENNKGLSQDAIANLIKYSLLLGAEKLMMALKSPRPLDCSTFDDSEVSIADNFVPVKNKNSVTSSRYDATIGSRDELVDLSKLMNFPAESIAFLAILMLKMASFQINLFMRFFTFPILLVNFWLAILIFPFQTLIWIRESLKKRLMRVFNASCLISIAFVFYQFRAQKLALRMALRLVWAISCMFYVLFVLFGLLVSGFVFGGLVMRNVVEQPIHTSEILNFDYTKTSPVAFVHIASSLVSNAKSRSIPYNHKLHLYVSLTLPESDYNRKLGIFQVRVESVSARNEVLASSSYPTMLRFKSQPIRLIETAVKVVPLVTGLQSEVQMLKIEIKDYIEGHEPTAYFKVILEQRAEFQAGSGVPEIYTTTLDIESELPRLKRVIWNWRRTIFVWIGISLFVGEVAVVLLVCRPILLLGGRSKGFGSKGKSHKNRLAWEK